MKTPVVNVEDDDLDAGLKSLHKESARRCIVTRLSKPKSELLRFVIAPDNSLAFDIAHKLPGRGAWVSCDKTIVNAALAKNIFARSFKKNVKAAVTLADDIEAFMHKRLLESLSLAHKAGLVISGQSKVEEAMGRKRVAALIQANDTSEAALEKVAGKFRAIKNTLSKEITLESDESQNESLQFPHKSVMDKPLIVRDFTSDALDGALGKVNVHHIALLAGDGSALFLARKAQYNSYNTLCSKTDDE
jgi:uncharacterized protein